MLGETVVFEMVGFLKIFAALEQHGCETISCTILYRNDDVKLVAVIACFMRRELPCIRLERGKFELTNQDSAGGKNSSVLM